MHEAEDEVWEETFAARVLDIVDAIPPGRVLTYGDVAAMLGSRGARAVGAVMARYGTGHPWWRVIRSGGLPPRGHEERARKHYRDERTPLSEGTEPPGYQVQYAVARWNPVLAVTDVTGFTTTDREND